MIATLPAFCNEVAAANVDYNSNCLECGYSACRRLLLALSCRQNAADIENTRKRLEKTTKPYAIRNLTAWITESESRLEKLIKWTEEAECRCGTHGPNGHRPKP